MTTRPKVSEAIGWCTMVLGIAIVFWSIDAFILRPKLNELDAIDFLLGVVIASTLAAVGLRLRARKSAWRPVFLGFIVSVSLCVLALLKAAQDFNGPH